MSRVRSPNYPQISLPEAIRRVEQIRAKEGRNAASREALAKLLGFGSLNGASGSVLSAISKYGLLEDAGDKELKVSDLTDAILFPHESDEKLSALAKAANKPALFAEIDEKWPDRPPTDENLRSYLMRRGFSQGALNNVITCYRETRELVTGESVDYDAGVVHGTKAQCPMPDPTLLSAQRRALAEANAAANIPPPPLQGSGHGNAPVISIMAGGGLVVNAVLDDREGVDALINMLTTIRGIVPQKQKSDDSETP